ncbi:MAG: translation initiation factor IF-2, partial [Oscillospiraceae bacterium]|nr:translation initiation factor IF-2 [Oscillospiraceae bacterium]
MSTLVKYRIGDVAKDFGFPSKVITEILGRFYEKPKSSQQVLTEEQLNLLFDVITLEHQIESLEQVFAVAPTQKKEPARKPAAEEKPAEEKPAAAAAAAAAAPKAPEKPKEPERKRERRVIDTSAVTVNAARFDDHADELVSERVQNYTGGKQKIGSRSKQQQRKKFGTKSRNEEQEKIRRLQLEIVKKTPLTVKIPDEITVGELASRMKKTAAEVIKCLM